MTLRLEDSLRASRTLPILLLLAACGGSSPAPKTPAPDAPDDGLAAGGEAAPTDDQASRVCAALFSLRDSGCEFLQGYNPPAGECEAELREAGDDPMAQAIAGCVLASADCAALDRCMEDAMATAAGPREAPTGPRLSESPSTMAEPIEVCMPAGEIEWIFEARCDDDSNPFVSYDHAHDARVGSVGAGGKHDNVIDLYEVRCPEKTYEVFMDMYAGC